MPSSVAAIVPKPGTDRVRTTHSVSRRARSRPGAGAAVHGGLPDQREQVGGRGLTGRAVAPDDDTMPGTRATR